VCTRAIKEITEFAKRMPDEKARTDLATLTAALRAAK